MRYRRQNFVALVIGRVVCE